MLKIAIIGTAGRGTDAPRLNKATYQAMIETTTRLVETIANGAEIELVSGGAAYADHLAVELFLQGKNKALTLHLPCPWDATKKALLDTGVFDWKTNPGGTANHYHRQFGKTVEKSTLLEIDTAIKKGASVIVGKGFHDRNTAVSKAEACIALTYGTGALLKDGGTADTMSKYLKAHAGNDRSYHIDLNTMTVFAGAKIPN